MNVWFECELATIALEAAFCVLDARSFISDSVAAFFRFFRPVSCSSLSFSLLVLIGSRDRLSLSLSLAIVLGWLIKLN
jgi:hypothetical protein